MWATGAALMVRSSDYWSVGGLDERFFAHMEEIDLCWRLRLKGRGVTCVPQSTAYHWGGATLNKSNPRKTFLNFRNNRLMLYKNLPESSLWKVMLVRGLLDMVAAVSFLCQGHFGDFKAVFKAYFAYRRLKKEYRSVRADIQRTAVVKDVPERRPYFLLWRYHIRRQHTFSSLEGET